MVPAAPLFPAATLNGDTFLATFDVPVQVGRMLCALAIAGFLSEVLVVEAGRAQARTLHLLAALNDSLRAITAEVGLEATLNVVVEPAQGLLETDTNFLALLAPDKRTLEVAASIGVRTEALRRWRREIGRSLPGPTVRGAQPAIVDHYMHQPGCCTPRRT